MAVITLTTDFGNGSPYVAAMKGVIYTINPSARIVDLSHAIAPQDVRAGAVVLDNTAEYFPAGTIHVAVVDPGVGSDRAIIYAEMASQRFVTPDNGILSRLASRCPPSKIIRVTERRFWRDRISSTFHGRDIMAPVAARLSLGLDPVVLGPVEQQIQELEWPEVRKVANQIEGEIVSVDSFGNLVTNITRDMIVHVPQDDSVCIVCDEHETRGIFATYSDQPPMTLIALINSSENLELAIVDENASLMLGVGVGTSVVLRW